jgi:hypothetical protein
MNIVGEDNYPAGVYACDFQGEPDPWKTSFCAECHFYEPVRDGLAVCLQEACTDGTVYAPETKYDTPACEFFELALATEYDCEDE